MQSEPSRFFKPLVFSLLFACSIALAEGRTDKKSRRVVAHSFNFQIDVPAWFQLTLNERLRGSAFLKIQNTSRDGQPIPATLSVIYSEPEKGKKYPQLLEPEEYSQIFTKILKDQGVKFYFLRAEHCELDGYKGVLVEYKQQQNDALIRTIQMNVVSPNGSERFIVTYGTFEEHVEVDVPFLENIVNTIELGLCEHQAVEE